MSMPSPKHEIQPADASEHHDVLRMIMEWIADRFADSPEADTSIDWEDGEEHDEPHGPAVL